ncbi:MAG: hypothetical protein FIB08_02515 [Candidatus Methanoperedens sp.]|nr:hypothetical protein [Candidatus Methanoperedens sp.]
MHKYLGELLDELDNSYPKPLTIEELRKRKISSDAILEALDAGLINYPPHYSGILTRRVFEKDNLNEKMPCNLSSKGFELLNQVRMEKTIEQLDDSIIEFNKSSDRAFNQLNETIKKFSESSEKSAKTLEIYTARLVNLTLLLVGLTLVLLIMPPETSQWEKYIGVLVIFVVVYILFPLKKNK